MALDSVTASDVMDDVITPTIENDEVELLIIAGICFSQPSALAPHMSALGPSAPKLLS